MRFFIFSAFLFSAVYNCPAQTINKELYYLGQLRDCIDLPISIDKTSELCLMQSKTNQNLNNIKYLRDSLNINDFIEHNTGIHKYLKSDKFNQLFSQFFSIDTIHLNLRLKGIKHGKVDSLSKSLEYPETNSKMSDNFEYWPTLKINLNAIDTRAKQLYFIGGNIKKFGTKKRR